MGLEEEEIYDPESPDSSGPSDPDATTPSAPAAKETKRKRESGGARSAMGSRSAGWVVAAFLGGVVVTLSAVMIAGTGTTAVRPVANTIPARAVPAPLRVIKGQASRTTVIGQAPVAAGPLAGCPAANLRVISGRPGQVTVRVGKLSGAQQHVVLRTVTPAKARRLMIVRPGNGHAVIRLIAPAVGPGVFRSSVKGSITIKGKLIGPGQVVLGPGQVVLGPGQTVDLPGGPLGSQGSFVDIGPAAQAAIVASPACGHQVVYLP